MHVRRIQKQLSFPDSGIIVMEQKVVWNSMFLIPLSNTISNESTGHVKVCVSVCLTGKANGRKRKLFIAFKAAKRGRESLSKEIN